MPLPAFANGPDHLEAESVSEERRRDRIAGRPTPNAAHRKIRLARAGAVGWKEKTARVAEFGW